MRRAIVTEVNGNEATVIFAGMNIQKKATIIRDLVVKKGDTVVVVFNADISDCVITGVI